MLRPVLSIVACFVAVGLAVQSATAATLTTQSILISTGVAGRCDIVNVGTKPITVNIHAIRFDGTIVTQANNININPAASTGIAVNSSFLAYYCKFFGNFSKLKVRAHAGINDGATKTLLVVPAY